MSPRRSDFVTHIGVREAGLVEAQLRGDFLAVFNQVLRRPPDEAKAAFDSLRVGLGLKADDFRSIHGTETDAYEIVAAAERISDSGESLSVPALEKEIRPGSPTSGRIAEDSLVQLLDEADRAYRDRYGAGPNLHDDPGLFANAGSSYLRAVALHVTTGESAVALDEKGKKKFTRLYDELRDASFVVRDRLETNQHFKDQRSGPNAAAGVGVSVGTGLVMSALNANSLYALVVAGVLGLVVGAGTPSARAVTGRRLRTAQKDAVATRDALNANLQNPRRR